MTTKVKQAQGPNGATAAMRPLDEYVYGTAVYMVIPVAKLSMDMSYQREQADSLISKIVKRFDVNKFEAPTVNIRQNGSHYVVDGGHRVAAAKRLGFDTVTCRVIHIADAEEPDLFIDLNRSRRWVTPVQTFKAEVANGNPAALEIERILGDRGLRVASSHSPTTISCTGTLHKIHATKGVIGLERVLDAALSWPDDEPRRFAGQLLQGLAVFFEIQPRVEDDRLADKLSRTTSGALIGRASSRWHAWRALDQRGGSLVDATAEEIKKQYAKR